MAGHSRLKDGVRFPPMARICLVSPARVLPFLITVTSRAFTRASKDTTSPSFHRSTVTVSPGNTGEENRAAWLLERAGIVVGIGLQHGAAGDAVGAHAVQDRPREAGGAWRIRDRSAADCGRRTAGRAAPGPAGSRCRRTGPARASAPRAARAGPRTGRRSRRRRARSASATSVASFSPVLVLQHGLVQITAPLSLPLSTGAEDASIGGDLAGDRQRLVEGDVALAVDHHQAVDVHIAGARAPGRHRGEGRHRLERTRDSGLLIDEGEFLLVHRIGAHADAIGVKHHLAIAIGVFLAEVFQRHQFIVLDRHRGGSSWIFLPSSCPRRRASSNHRRPRLLDPRFAGMTTRRIWRAQSHSSRRKERQRRAVGRLEHHLHPLADLQLVEVAVDEVGQQRRAFVQGDIADRVGPSADLRMTLKV